MQLELARRIPAYIYGPEGAFSAEVSETISPDAFAVAGAVDPLLIIGPMQIPALDTGQMSQGDRDHPGPL